MDYLEELISKNEGKTLEFKRDLSSPEGFLRTVIAFSNTSGGKIAIGVDDKTKAIRGVDDPLKLEEQIASLVSQRITPIILLSVELVLFRKKQVILVEIYPSSRRPHYFKSVGEELGTYVRVGSTNRVADKAMIQELHRTGSNLTFDEEPMPELRSDAIDLKTVSEMFAQKRKILEPDLETLGIVTRYQGHRVPTTGGMILFGKERERYFPNAWIQAGRFEGKTKKTILDSMEIRGYLPGSIEKAVEFVSKYAVQSVEIGPVRNKRMWNLPPSAIREAIINAVVHADYSQKGSSIRIAIFDDRIEIENPGILPLGMDMDDLSRGISNLRNLVIARVFFELGLIEQWGSGVRRIIEECKEHGLPEPIFEEIGMRFRVTFFTLKKTAPTIDELDQIILSALSREGDLSTAELAKYINRSVRAARTRLKLLTEKGMVREIAVGPNDPKKRYRVSL